MFDFFRRKKNKDNTDELNKQTENLVHKEENKESFYQEATESEKNVDNLNDNDKLVFEPGSSSTEFEIDKKVEDIDVLSEKIDDEIAIKDDPLAVENEKNESFSDNQFDEDIKGEEKTYDEVKKLGFFDRIRNGLVKTRDQFSSQVKNLFTANVKIDDDMYEELEEILISADIGMDTTLAIVDSLRYEIKERNIKDTDQIYPLLEEIMVRHLDRDNLNNDLNINDNDLAIILVIGVNGVGKTTTIGKLAYNLKNEGKTVMLAAADTFRAAAIEQLGEWADRADVEMIAHKEGSDPSAVIFDAIQSAKNKNVDVLICDTAGRLHNKKNLMKELEKINKTIDSHAGKATRDNILVLDATTGQNAVSQLREFKNVTDITGLILTKLDGTAKGGIIFPLQYELNVPVKYIGLGEGIDNLEKFDSKTFVDALF